MAVDYSTRLAGDGSTRIQSFAFAVGVCICLILSAYFFFETSESANISDFELERRINPNDAPVSSLVRLPGIGASKAAAVVAYREQYRLSGAEGKAFRQPSDLEKVKGIGPKTVEAIAESLSLE